MIKAKKSRESFCIKPAIKYTNNVFLHVIPAKLVLDLIGERESRKYNALWIPALPPDQVRGAAGMTVFKLPV